MVSYFKGCFYVTLWKCYGQISTVFFCIALITMLYNGSGLAESRRKLLKITSNLPVAPFLTGLIRVMYFFISFTSGAIWSWSKMCIKRKDEGVFFLPLPLRMPTFLHVRCEKFVTFQLDLTLFFAGIFEGKIRLICGRALWRRSQSHFNFLYVSYVFNIYLPMTMKL